MGSIGAMRKGSRDRYFQDEFELNVITGEGTDKLVPEGIEAGWRTRARSRRWSTSWWAACGRHGLLRLPEHRGPPDRPQLIRITPPASARATSTT